MTVPDSTPARPPGVDAINAKRHRPKMLEIAAVLTVVALVSGIAFLVVANNRSASRKRAKVAWIVQRACHQRTVEAARDVIFAAEDAGDLSIDDDGMLKVYDCLEADPTNDMDFGELDSEQTPAEETTPPQTFDPNADAVLDLCEEQWSNDSQGFYNCVQAFKVDGRFVDPYGE